MRVLNLCFQDNAGSAFTLSHALNKHGHVSINLRAQNNYINYPTIASVSNYNREGCAGLVEKADVVVFHSAIRPYIEGLAIDEEILATKKKVLYLHGSEARSGAPILLKQADELLGDYKVFISTPDLKEYVTDSIWMPCIRSFQEIHDKYGTSRRDLDALNEFGVPFTKTVVGHSPTNTQVKGSPIFQRVITKLMDVYPNIEYVSITQQPWDSCLRTMAGFDIFYDQALIGAYGLAAVEASVFRIPIFCHINEEVNTAMEEASGMTNPFIQWTDEESLLTRTYHLCEHKDERQRFGKLAYEFCKSLHDEKPGVERFIKAVEAKK